MCLKTFYLFTMSTDIQFVVFKMTIVTFYVDRLCTPTLRDDNPNAEGITCTRNIEQQHRI